MTRITPETPSPGVPGSLEVDEADARAGLSRALYIPVLARFVATFGPPRGRAAELLETGEPLAAILDDTGPLGDGMANRLIQPPGEAQLLLSQDLDEHVLAGHCLDTESIALLRSGRKAAFLQRRAKEVEAVVYDHVQSRALFGFPDGPDLTELFDEGDELD